MAYSSTHEQRIFEASKKEGLKEARKNVAYRKDSLQNLPPELEMYWRAKSEFNFEDTELTENDLRQIEETALKKADEIL